MDAINIPADNIPIELKSCEQILKRAKELKKAEPVMAYWCTFWAAQKALAIQDRSRDSTRLLMSLLDVLEQMRALLAADEAVTSEAAGAAHVENFALKVFMSADNDDRAGVTGKATIRKFVVAGQFIEVLQCFENGMTEEMKQKLQYARWKAADGAKALREGREPTSGPPMPETDINPFPELPSGSPGTANAPTNEGPGPSRGSFSSSTRPTIHPGSGSNGSTATQTPIVSPKPSPALHNRANLPGLDTNRDSLGTPKRNESFAWSTVATPGVPDDGSDEIEKRFDLISSKTVPSAPPLEPEEEPSSGGPKNVRFMGPDGAPLSPAHTHFTVDSYDAPSVPPPTEFDASPSSPSPKPSATGNLPRASAPPDNSSTNPAGRVRGNSVSSSSNPSARDNTTNGTPARQSINPPPPPPPSLASYPAAPPSVPQPHGLGLSAPHTSSTNGGGHPTSAPRPSAPPTRKQIEQTQKHARWAISALEFDDVDTAKLELRKALAALEG